MNPSICISRIKSISTSMIMLQKIEIMDLRKLSIMFTRSWKILRDLGRFSEILEDSQRSLKILRDL